MGAPCTGATAVEIAGWKESTQAASIPSARPGSVSSRRGVAFAAGLLLLLVAASAAWWARRPNQAAGHGMTVRLSGFHLLSSDLPATLRETVDAEITAAFSIDGVVGVSSASAPAPGAAPAYTLGGTIQRDGNTIRVITRMINERSGATLWSKTLNYTGTKSRGSRATSQSTPATSSVVDCSARPPITSRCPMKFSATTCNFVRDIGIPIFGMDERPWSPRSESSLPSRTFPGAGRRSPVRIGKLQ